MPIFQRQYAKFILEFEECKKKYPLTSVRGVVLG